MSLFEITITGSKTFYVEADNEEQALEDEIVADEMTMTGDFEWEADTGTASKLNDDREKIVRERYSKLIV